MGLLHNGEWVDQWYDTEKSAGKFVRENAQFRHWITKDGNAGPTGNAGFKAATDRYHLYVSLACPWAHRTLIFRQLKSLQQIIPVTVVEPHMLNHGWEFAGKGQSKLAHPIAGAQADPLFDKDYLYQIYLEADPDYSGRVTVPVLWDKANQTIVSNESADIIRMFNSAFNHLTGNTLDFYPEALQNEIDQLNALIYKNVNNGVYRAGFATSQTAYQEAFADIFDTLDMLDKRLQQQRYLTGNTLTEADWRLFTTLIRFDAVYVGHFKANKKRINDYSALSGYVRELYQYPGIEETVNFEHIKQHYYFSHDQINPTRIVPVGPKLNFNLPHQRHGL